MNHNPMPEMETEETPKAPFEAFVYHQRRALEETGKALEALVPDGFREHGSTAGKEFLKGFQVLVDAAIVEVEKAAKRMQETADAAPAPAASSDDDRPSTTGRAKIKVEVE